MVDLLAFTTSYSEQDQCKISFAWNGKHAKDFVDSNLHFRKGVIRFVLENEQLYFPVELIKDLFLEEAKCSVQAWGIGNDFHKLGEKLIRSGKNIYLDEFLVGAYASFDTYCSSRMMDLQRHEIESILEELNTRIKDPNRVEMKDRYQSGIELFESFLKVAQREGLDQITRDDRATKIKFVRPSKLRKLIRSIFKRINKKSENRK